jgi:periplasmic protein TonB
MLISKFDLYKSEWLELVFDDRNKAYGAYELRQHYSRTMVKVMVSVFLTIAAMGVAMRVLTKPVVLHTPTETIIPVVLHPYVMPPHVAPAQPAHVRPPAATTPHVLRPFVVSPVPTAIEPPKQTEITGPAGPAVTPGETGIDPGLEGPVNGTGTTATSGPDVVYSPSGIERMPEPYGGASAWSKFLNKHLKYPDMAIDARMSGKVWVSFIVEKDGHLSNIVVDRGAGYGMDEEALRVLKLAPAWKPGIQNGQPVRVKYNIPINFQLGDDN